MFYLYMYGFLMFTGGIDLKHRRKIKFQANLSKLIYIPSSYENHRFSHDFGGGGERQELINLLTIGSEILRKISWKMNIMMPNDRNEIFGKSPLSSTLI